MSFINKNRANLIETNLHSLWFDGVILTARMWSVFSVNICLIIGVIFGLLHFGKGIHLIICHQKI